MSIRELRTFLAIHEHGSFLAASEKLGLSQSAVSLQMKKLEQDLDTVLFDRSGHRSLFNMHGRALLPKAQDLVAQYDQLGNTLNSDASYVGKVIIGAVNTVQVGVLPYILQDVLSKHPNLQVVMRSGMSGPLALALEARHLDFALTTEPQMVLPPSMEWHACFEEEFYVVSPFGDTGQSTREILEAHPYVRFDRQAWIGRIIDQRLQKDGVAVQEIIESDSLETALQLAHAGLGVTVLPLPKFRVEALQDKLTLVPFADPPLTRGLGVLALRDHIWSDLITEFVELARASMS